MTLDFTRPVTTRDGRAVRILCTDAGGHLPVVGLIGSAVRRWQLDGTALDSPYKHEDDIINPPVKRRGWVNLYKDCNGKPITGECVYETEEEARRKMSFSSCYVSTVQLPEWEDVP